MTGRSARSGWSSRAAAAVLVALVSGGCSGPDGVMGEVALHDTDGATMEALGGGVLVREDGCLYIESAGDRQVPVFPRGGVGWDGTVLTFDGEEYRLGDEITFGGGQSRPGPDATIPPGCDRTVLTFLVGDPRM